MGAAMAEGLHGIRGRNPSPVRMAADPRKRQCWAKGQAVPSRTQRAHATVLRFRGIQPGTAAKVPLATRRANPPSSPSIYL